MVSQRFGLACGLCAGDHHRFEQRVEFAGIDDIDINRFDVFQCSHDGGGLVFYV